MDSIREELDPHRVFERISDAFVALDRDGRYTFVNARAGEIFGREPSSLIGKHIWTEFPEGRGQPFQHAYEKAMAEQRPATIEEYYPPWDRWFENRIYPSPDGLTIYFMDVTERRVELEAMRNNQRRLDDAQQVAHMGSWEWDVDRDVVTWSRELYRIYGLLPSEPMSFESYLAHIHPDDREQTRRLITRAFEDKQPFAFRERIIHSDGQIHHLWSRGEVLLDAEGGVGHMVGTCIDVTERLRIEQMDAGIADILAGIAAQRPMAENLGRICRLHEQLNPGALCSILLLDAEGRHVLHGSAPSLPDEYNAAMHGQEIGDGHGSCGTAAARRERVIVSDIATHPYWAPYRQFALKHGLLACWSTPVIGSSGRVAGTFAVYFREVREPRQEELDHIDRMLSITAIAIESGQLAQRLHERDRFFDLSTEVYCIYDTASRRIIHANRAFCDLTGFTEQELGARNYGEFVHPDDRPTVAEVREDLRDDGCLAQHVEFRFLCKDGSYRWLSWQTLLSEGLGYAVANDITERKLAESQLEYASAHDTLTTLSHYPLLEAALGSLLASGQPVWVLFIGIDRFQAVNESMGHVIGDLVLQQVAERLREELGSAGRIARFAGDEFVVVAGGITQGTALGLASRLRRTVSRPIEAADYRLVLTASIGISHSPEHGSTPDQLLRRAEGAMTRAKRQGRDRVCEFSLEMMQDIEDRLSMGSHLRAAIRGSELSLHYQPQLLAGSREFIGFEALLRWDSRELGSVRPDRFIPVAEDLGVMPEIGEWVIDEACRQARAWLDEGHANFHISVNISALELQRSGLVEHVRNALRRHRVPASVLGIELTESSLMENVKRVRGKLRKLRALGTTVSLDDFGTGYSSLAYLKQFPIDKLKIDQRFVRGLPLDVDDAAIARTIVAMAHQLRMVVAAEGVETEEQALFLDGIGCDELQGFHLGRPLPASEAAAFFPPSPVAPRAGMGA